MSWRWGWEEYMWHLKANQGGRQPGPGGQPGPGPRSRSESLRLVPPLCNLGWAGPKMRSPGPPRCNCNLDLGMKRRAETLEGVVGGEEVMENLAREQEGCREKALGSLSTAAVT